MKKAPIEAQKTVELVECGVEGVREAKVLEFNTSAIELDRFMRISTTAEQVNNLNLKKGTIVLDVGGFDGALALFLPSLRVWVIDPQTTGGNGLKIPFPDKHFDVVVSIDAIEHLPRKERAKFLQELVRVTRSKLFINFPEARSMIVQKAVLSVLDNKFIQEHVNYQLPTSKEVVDFLKEIRPNLKIKITSYLNVYSWLAWFVLFHTDKERGLNVSKFLKGHKNNISNCPCLYELLECNIGELA